MLLFDNAELAQVTILPARRRRLEVGLRSEVYSEI